MGTSKTLRQVLSGTSDAAIRFDDLRQLLLSLGFEMRIRGSHHTFRKAGIEEKVNLQREGNEAKPYQVRQVRNIVLKYHLGESE
jgi:predicted RNA binding protein YcfA (HicA-like mRNA interferase family)